MSWTLTLNICGCFYLLSPTVKLELIKAIKGFMQSEFARQDYITVPHGHLLS